MSAWNRRRQTTGIPLPADVERLLAQRAGLNLGQDEKARAGELLRAQAGRRFPNLTGAVAGPPESERAREIDTLAARLTPGETFFFRDHGQFELLRFHLLPELIQRRRPTRTLRLWSAGCASGEEAYSLAMLVDMVLPERRDWNVTVIGTDINAEALARAHRGRYGKWSFRMAPASLQSRFFRPEGDHWVVNDDIRRLVSFRPGNLVSDPLPDPVLRELDLILCRNVLIYFTPAAIRTVAAKLAACLADGGYLLTGHTELMGHPAPGLASRLFPEGVVYQRAGAEAMPLAPLPPAPVPPASPPPRPAAAPPGPPPPHRETAPAEARSLADRGDYGGAEAACRAALAMDPMVPASHFLLAQLAQLRGDYREAEDQLNRTLYLAPGHVAAHLELAALHERAGQAGRALARRRAALDLLRTLPADAPVEPFDATAGQLALWLLQTEAL